MRGVTFSQRGEPADVARVSDLPTAPEPGVADVRVSISLAPLHRGDLIGIETAPDGTFAPRPLGSEGVGVITATGETVGSLRVGDRVSVFPAQGAWSQQITVPAEAAVAIPATVSDEVAAVTLVNGITSHLVLRAVDEVSTAAGAARNTPLIVSAPASAVGRLIVRQALDRGVPVIAVARTDRSAATVRSFFPEVAVVVTEHDGWQSRLREFAGDRGVPAIADAHGGDFVHEILPFLADAGTLVVWGDLAARPWTLSTSDLLMRELRVQAVSISRWMARPDDVKIAGRQAAVRLAEQWPELFSVYATYPLDRLRTAVEAVRANGTGTVLLRLN
jgi:NADPH:quinone reductase-like Zn-dependent oxidoreductase